MGATNSSLSDVNFSGDDRVGIRNGYVGYYSSDGGPPPYLRHLNFKLKLNKMSRDT